MYRTRTLIPALLGLLLVGAGSGQADLGKLKLPEGFQIRIVTDEVGNARQMALAADGTLFVGSWTQGKVYAVPKALTGERPEVITLAEGLALPSGVTEAQRRPLRRRRQPRPALPRNRATTGARRDLRGDHRPVA